MSDTKVCNKCGAGKPLHSFHRAAHLRDGRTNTCKECVRAYDAEAQKRRPRPTPDQSRSNHLIHRYGMTREQYDRILTDQDNRCGICKSESNKGKAFCVDHDHSCCPGQRSCGRCIRGLICGVCNRTLGMMCDDPIRMEAMIRYLACRVELKP